MKLVKVLPLVVAMVSALSLSAHANHEGAALQEACKAECPSAKNEDEAHACMEAVAKKKQADKKFKKSACFHAYEEHEKAEKSDKHSH